MKICLFGTEVKYSTGLSYSEVRLCWPPQLFPWAVNCACTNELQDEDSVND
jgi:hypothetical protein